MSKLRESARFAWSDKPTRLLMFLLVTGAVLLTAALCNYSSKPATRESGKQVVETSNSSSTGSWWNSQSHKISCSNCRTSIGAVRVYAGASPVVTTRTCSNCGITAKYETEYTHTVKMNCRYHANNWTTCKKITFPCRPGVVQTKDIGCDSDDRVQYQCPCKR